MRQTINHGTVANQPNTIAQGCPFQAKAMEGGFTSFNERIDARKVRARSASFHDHFSQATLFYNSQSEAEKSHIMHALRFELGKVERETIRIRVLGLLSQVDKGLAQMVAEGIGVDVPKKPEQPMNMSFGADTDPKKVQSKNVPQGIDKSPALSMANTIKNSIKSRQIAILVADGVDEVSVTQMKMALTAESAMVKLVAPKLGLIKGKKGGVLKADQTFLTAASVLFDAVYVPGGAKSIAALLDEQDPVHFVNEAYKHCKAIAIDDEGIELLNATYIGKSIIKAKGKAGVIINGSPKEFIKAIAQHRFWEREKKDKVPA
jgi:catalase